MHLKMDKQFELLCILALMAVILLPCGAYAARGEHPPLKRLLPMSFTEVAGKYHIDDRFDFRFTLILKPSGVFSFLHIECMGVPERRSGTYIIHGNRIVLRPKPWDRTENDSAFDRALMVIPWDSRIYLIPPARMLEFCNAINAGLEPRRSDLGYFYLRVGDENKSVEGSPALPIQWRAFVLRRPVIGNVIRIDQDEVVEQRKSDGCRDWDVIVPAVVTVDVGSQDGLQPGMRLFGHNDKRPYFRADLVVLSVEETSAHLEVLDHFRPIKRGDKVLSRDPDLRKK